MRNKNIGYFVFFLILHVKAYEKHNWFVGEQNLTDKRHKKGEMWTDSVP